MWVLALFACGEEFYRAEDLAAFDAQSIEVRGDYRDGAMFSLNFYLLSGAPEDCRYPEEATFTVNGAEGNLIAEPGPGDDCSGSVFLYMDDALAAVTAGGPDAEVRRRLRPEPGARRRALPRAHRMGLQRSRRPRCGRRHRGHGLAHRSRQRPAH